MGIVNYFRRHGFLFEDWEETVTKRGGGFKIRTRWRVRWTDLAALEEEDAQEEARMQALSRRENLAVLLDGADLALIDRLRTYVLDGRGFRVSSDLLSQNLSKELFLRAGAAKVTGAQSVPLLIKEIEGPLEALVRYLERMVMAHPQEAGTELLMQVRKFMARLYVQMGEAITVDQSGPLPVAHPAMGDGRS